jgi:hypothetical protein
MKNNILTLLAVALLVSGPLFAQGKISSKKGSKNAGQASTLNVKKGDMFSYNVDMLLEMTQTMGGQDISTSAQSSASGELAAVDASKGRIDWSYAMKDMRVKITSPMMPGQAKDTVIEVPTQHFTTDNGGRIVSIQKLSSESSQMMQLMQSLSSRKQLRQWFAPEMLSGHKSGDSWTEKGTDTVTNEGMGMEMRTTSDTRYTFEGTVDTLGIKAARLRVETTSMQIEGSLSMSGMDMAIDGDGVTSGTAYYSLSDGLLLVNNSETQTNSRVSMSGQAEMVIPMTQKISTMIVRK